MFLNPDRPTAPDIDSDFDYLRREEVIQYIVEKYGRNHVSKIGSYTTMSSKMALKDAGRVLGYEHAYLNELTNTIPTFNGVNMDLEDTLEEIPEIIEANKANPELFELAIDIQGIPRSQSVHASGVIVAPQELDVTIPLGMSKGTTVTQYDGETLEDLGYFKFDILGIKYLSVIRIALELIKERHDKDIDIYKVDMDDPQVYRMIQRGETEGIFQLASSGMTEVFTGLSHLNFEDLSIGIALYRPGSMDNIPEYQDRKNGLKPVTYPHSDLESILEETQGILVYQEQLMAMAQVLGGYSQGESDNLRKATGKKSEKVMNEVLPELEQRILDNGYDQEVATYAIEAIKPFVGYGLTTF